MTEAASTPRCEAQRRILVHPASQPKTGDIGRDRPISRIVGQSTERPGPVSAAAYQSDLAMRRTAYFCRRGRPSVHALIGIKLPWRTLLSLSPIVPRLLIAALPSRFTAPSPFTLPPLVVQNLTRTLGQTVR